MTYEETISMLFQPGMYDIWCLGMALVFASWFIGGLLIVVLELLLSLIRRYIWPGKKKVVTQTQDPGAGAAG